jgi:DNA-binding LacI/PurR family transcriptional regulator
MPSIHDVAKRAGVSVATVSRVLAEKPHVRPEVRELVLKIVSEIGYQPNRSARRLRASSSDVIGLIVDLQNPFFISVVHGMEEVAYENHMSTLLCNTAEDLKRQQINLNVMQAENVAGLILAPCPLTEASALDSVRKSGLPLVVLDRTIEGLDADIVQVDNIRGAYTAVKHLIDLGHERIGTVLGPSSLSTGRERLRGYEDALKDAGKNIDPALIKRGGAQKEDGYVLARELMLSGEPPTALFIGNSLMTLGALQAMRELNVRVPQDVALVGFDDMAWSSELCPPLTAISQPTYELGREAVDLLLRRLAEPNALFRTVVLQTHLIIRESCGAGLQRGG